MFSFTRLFGAPFGDFLTKPLKDDGLSLPRKPTSAIALLLLVIVLFSSRRREGKK